MNILGIVAATFSTSASLPQLFSETPQTLQLRSIILRCIGGICWSVYGILKSDYPLMVASCLVSLIEIILCLQRNRALSLIAQCDNSQVQTSL